MQIRATIRKLFHVYTVDALLRHIANELKEEAAHLETVGAPLRAKYIRREVAILMSASKAIEDLEY